MSFYKIAQKYKILFNKSGMMSFFYCTNLYW